MKKIYIEPKITFSTLKLQGMCSVSIDISGSENVDESDKAKGAVFENDDLWGEEW